METVSLRLLWLLWVVAGEYCEASYAVIRVHRRLRGLVELSV